MGLRVNGYATVWSVEPEERYTKVRLSTSKKSQDGTYEQDFGGYVRFIGDAHKKAASLKERDRIKIGEFEVTNSYNAEKKVTYTNIAVFAFEMSDGTGGGSKTTSAPTTKPSKKPTKTVDSPVDEDDPF